MGAWNYVHGKLHRILRDRAQLRHIARPPSPSPASGSSAVHDREQEQLFRRFAAVSTKPSAAGSGRRAVSRYVVVDRPTRHEHPGEDRAEEHVGDLRGIRVGGELATVDALTDQLVAGRPPGPYELGVRAGELVAPGLRRQQHRDRPPDRRALEHREVAVRHGRGGRRATTPSPPGVCGCRPWRARAPPSRGRASSDSGGRSWSWPRRPPPRPARPTVRRIRSHRTGRARRRGSRRRPRRCAAGRVRRRTRSRDRHRERVLLGELVGLVDDLGRRGPGGEVEDHDHRADEQHDPTGHETPAERLDEALVRRRQPATAATASGRPAIAMLRAASPRRTHPRASSSPRRPRSAGAELAGEEVGDLRAVDRRHDRADDGDAERATHLPRRVVDGGSDAGLGERQRAHDRVGGRGHHETHAGRHDHQPPRDLPVVGVDLEAHHEEAGASAVSVRPVAIVAFEPNRSAMWALDGATIIIVNAYGSSRIPDSSGV